MMRSVKKQQTKLKKWKIDFKDYNKSMRILGCKEKTWDDYVTYRSGKSKYTPKIVKGLFETTNLIRKSPKVTSGFGIGSISGVRAENKYTGNEIMGIAVMHKSNFVPVRTREAAEDISKMRRN